MSGAGNRSGREERGQPRWSRGDQILWTYTNPAHPGLYDQRPATVIADDEKHLALWLESGTRMLHHVLADGCDIRTADGLARFGAPRAQGRKRWQGPGIVVVFQPGADYSVWFFENRTGPTAEAASSETSSAAPGETAKNGLSVETRVRTHDSRRSARLSTTDEGPSQSAT